MTDHPIEPGLREENVAKRIEYEMRQRGWSQERLAQEMAKAGCPIHQSAISKIVRPKDGKRRTIGLDEAFAFAEVFEVSIGSLVIPIDAVQNAEIRKLYEETEHLTEQAKGIATEIANRQERLRLLAQH